MHTTATDVQPQPLTRELRPVWVVSAAASAVVLAAAVIIPPVTRRLTRR
jgi:hypothetical protein